MERQEELVVAAEKGDLEAVRRLVDGGADVNSRDEDGRTVLVGAADNGCLDIVKFLVGCGADVSVTAKKGSTALMRAAGSGHLNVVKYLVDLGADVNATADDGWTPLKMAARYGHLDVVKFLVESGADVNAGVNSDWDGVLKAAGEEEYGGMALLEAVFGGHLDIVIYLVDHGADLNATAAYGVTALMRAAQGGHSDIAKFLVDLSVDVNANGDNKWSALMSAARSSHLDIVKYLIEFGADVDATDNNGSTALIWAAEGCHSEVVKYLVDSGADVNASDGYGRPALVFAAYRGDLDVVSALVNLGADVNAADKVGWTALMRAAERGHLNIVEYLVTVCADVHASDNDQWTALSRAAKGGHLEVVKYLVDSGADVNATDGYGRPALMIAAYRGDSDIAKTLVDFGADVNATDNNRSTALMRAAERGYLDIVDYLIVGGSNVNASDNDGWTALSKAAKGGHLEVVKYLIGSGADVNTTDNIGWAALTRAAERGHLDAVKYLIDVGGDVSGTDNIGWTSLMRAAERGHLDIVKYIISCGANARATNKDGMTAAGIAAQNGHLDIHRMLTNHLSRSPMVSIVTSSTPPSKVSSSHPQLLISPFDLSILEATHYINSAADVIATWLDAQVALKLFVLDTTSTTFEHEVAVWHQLRHPNIIKLYGACDVGHHLFVCELANKGSVVDYLKSCSPESQRPWKYLYHAALGLAYLHERGIIHGDLRGSNILIGDDDQAKLANFGLSGLSHPNCTCEFERSVSRGFVGSMRWQSPELLRGGKPSQASDVYALGLCVAEVLTGKSPWHGKNDERTRLYKELWDPESSDDHSGSHILEPFDSSEICRQMMKRLCCRDPTLRLSASICVCMFNDSAKQEDDNIATRSMQCAQSHTQHKESKNDQSRHNELPMLWDKIQDLNKDGTGVAPHEPYHYRSIIEDITKTYDAIRSTPQPNHLIEQSCSVLHDTVGLVQNNRQTTLMMRLPSTRATGNNAHALRHRITSFKKQLGIHQKQDHNIDTISENTGTRTTQETQMFVSEVSKTWLILDELETTEERTAFLSYLYSEISERRANYSDGQIEIMQQAYDDIKGKADANEDIVTNLPVWFIPWYELSYARGIQVEIGSGGFGSVYLAKWLDSDVVIKRLESHNPEDDKGTRGWSLNASSTISVNAQRSRKDKLKTFQTEDRSMFEREVNIWFHLSHPHVVRLFGACHVGRQPFFVCEYASNGSLDKYLVQNPDEIWRKLHEAALGLLYLHERGIVHCDLKCNNIVVGSDKKAKVTDFGLSLAASVGDDDGTETSGKNITGAWNWLAPELMLGLSHTPTRESDVFSFGMCVIEALRVVAVAQAEPEERDKMPPRVPWQHADRETVKYYMKRNKLPDRPLGCTDVQWELVERMCKFDPSERIQMCTVVDELAVLTGTHQHKQHPFKRPESILSQLDVLSMVSSTKNLVAHELAVLPDGSPHGKIYQVHELLWTRIEDIQTRFDADENIDAMCRLGLLSADAESRTKVISAHSDSPVDFTQLSLQAYDLHRRLDKLMAAVFVRFDDGDDVVRKRVHDWRRRCYEILGVDSSVASQLLGIEDQDTPGSDGS